MSVRMNYMILLLASLTIVACKKVIDVKLKNADVQTVITGEINNLPGPYLVKVSKSVDFTSENNFPGVSGAIVTVTSQGVTDTLREQEPGNYYTQKTVGTPGVSYTLKVVAGDKSYTAISQMPNPVRLDSLTFVEGRGSNIYPVANFQDPSGIHNYYQFVEFVNGKKLGDGRGNLVFDDRLSDGRYITRTLYDDSSDIKKGVVLKVQMKCIDQDVFTYLNELLQNAGDGGGFSSPAPANPQSNISGGSLGYFSANTVSSKTVEIQ